MWAGRSGDPPREPAVVSPSEVISQLAVSERQWHSARVVVELAAVAAGSLSGSLHAIRREYDLVGVTVIAVAAGLGGGIIRDLLIAQGPVLALEHPGLLLTALFAAAVGMVLGHRTRHVHAVLWIVEALALGLLTVAGIQRAEEIGLRVIPALFLGVVGGTGGGLLRDVLCRETPALLVPGRPFAVAALFGGLVYFGSSRALDWPVVFSEWLGILAAFVLRAVGTWRRWVMPRPDDVTHRIQTWRRRSKRPGTRRAR